MAKTHYRVFFGGVELGIAKESDEKAALSFAEKLAHDHLVAIFAPVTGAHIRADGGETKMRLEREFDPFSIRARIYHPEYRIYVELWQINSLHNPPAKEA